MERILINIIYGLCFLEIPSKTESSFLVITGKLPRKEN
jgi:hypothetical protein